MYAPQTICESGSGATWRRNHQCTSRIDWILFLAVGPAWIEWTKIGYKQVQQLKLGQCATWRDHAPVICCFWYHTWFDSITTHHPHLTYDELDTLNQGTDLQL